MIGKITRQHVEGGYIWGLVIDDEFVTCPRIIELYKKIHDTTIMSGTEIEIIKK